MTVASTPSVRLSQRVQRLKPSATLAVTAKVAALRAAGHDVIGFGAGEPDFDTPEPIKDAAIAALRAGQTGYAPVPGPEAVRAVIAEKMARDNGITCAARDIVINVGAKHSVYLALQALVDPGQEVIVPTPAWVSYAPMIELCGGTVVEVPGALANDFKITPDQLEAAITPNTAAILINSPSNPCGITYEPDELRALGDVLAGHDHVTILSDEIYEKLVYGGMTHFSLGSIPALADRVVTINGMSKAYAMTGWRLGYVCAPGDDGAVAKAIAKLQGQMTSHPCTFLYPAIADALQHRAPEVEAMRQAFEERGTLIHRLLTAMPGIECPRPTGAFYVFPSIEAFFGLKSPAGRTIDSALTFAEGLLEEALVGVVPGDDFGTCARRHIRMSYACSVDQINEGCRRMADWLAKLTPAR